MKNLLTNLQDHIFMMIEKLNDDELVGDSLAEEIKRSLAINELAKTAVANGALMVKAADTLYGLPVSDDLPLLPHPKAGDTYIVSGKRDTFIPVPKAGGSRNGKVGEQ